MNPYWSPGVNNLAAYGRWAFHEFTSAYVMERKFDEVVAAGFSGGG